jgi:hypothetical protein
MAGLTKHIYLPLALRSSERRSWHRHECSDLTRCRVAAAGATLNLTLGYKPAVGDSIMLISNNGTGAVVGTFKGLAQNATFVLNGMTFRINYQGGDGNDVVVTRIA